MKLIESIEGLSLINRRNLCFVPTMGALHAGHIALVRKAKELTGNVAVSIFVNPAQFNNPEDLKKYPRTLERDLELLEGLADYVFTPTVSEIYGPENKINVNPGPLADLWEGADRPGHFQGVVTVVSILFNLIQPESAVFGEKDFQQLVIVENLVQSLHFPIKIIRGATVREPSGLALSSRNERLSRSARDRAAFIFEALSAVKSAFDEGISGAEELIQIGNDTLKNIGEYKLAYFAIVDQKNLEPQITATANSRCLVALTLENVRLIDNIGFQASIS